MKSYQVNSDLPFAVTDRRTLGYFTIDNILIDTYGAQLGPHGIAVYAALARFANRDSECYPSYRTITERTGVSRSQIIREIAKMHELKIILVTPRVDEKGNRTSHLYTLLDIVGGGSTQEPGGSTYQEPGDSTQEPKQSLLKKNTRRSDNKKVDSSKSYLPPPDVDPLTRH